MIFISTGGFYNSTAFDTCNKLFNAGIKGFELSGGKPSANYINEFTNFNEEAYFQVHNYFPPPQEPFVLNLASLNDKIYLKSRNHILKALNLCKKLNSKYYSFHAGFLIDPKVEELGKRVEKRNLFPKEQAIALFIERVNAIDEYAKKLEIEILIENNVISENNFLKFDLNPFLMADKNDCIEVMNKTSSNVNLLIDVAHLKVSSQSLNFSKEIFLKECDPWIKAYHFSDNDGKKDSNESMTDQAWFWPHIKKGLDYYSIEVYNSDTKVLLDQLNLVKSQLN